jgi:predicted 2-oxoglutarate/Fe(II)-dependent dioxygenase YbiX
MRDDLAEHLFTIDGLLSPAECDELVRRGEALGFEAATVATRSGPVRMTQVRDNDRVTFDDAELANSLWERVERHVPAELGTSVAAGLNERLRFYRYEPGQRFNAHRDGVFERSSTERSRLTFMVYLNEDLAGGETSFYSEQRVGGLRTIVATVRPKTGTGIFFAHTWWHEGARVVSGRKYVLRTDVIYADGPAG